MITFSRLKEALHYDPLTGHFTWLERPNRRIRIGSLAGAIHSKTGVVTIQVDGKEYKAHRLAWLYMTESYWPNLIDHKNLKRGDNRWDNLREANKSLNAANCPARSGTASGYKGVTRGKKEGEWRAMIKKKGRKRIYLGVFTDPAKAHEAYMNKARELFGEFARAK